jgi:probable HAF family extracellular repeat protein
MIQFPYGPGSFWLYDYSGTTPPYLYQTRAFLWDKQKGMRDLGTLPGGTDAQAFLINEAGQVVGFSYTDSTQSGACFALATSSFIWEKDKGMIDLGGFGGTCTQATALNSKGQIVGQSNTTGDTMTRAFLWENKSIQDLGGSLGGDFTGAFALNEQGLAVGFAYLPGDIIFHAILWKHVGDMTDLGVVGNDQCSYAGAINAKGQVVGSSIPVCNSETATPRAILWEDGSIVDLNALIPTGSALYLQYTNAINDRGEIAGTGGDVSGNQHAFLLIPCDENHPDVEGCNYDPVDATSASDVRPAQMIQAPTASPSKMMTRFRCLRAGRNRRFGPPQTSPE